ncbi:hypothetical protein CC80DRAFT_537294 [Byssothecium circinans]|uniref:Heterokaryon incompatibility domain-containing protein n=1 Tax=Byssothecium circinans TaxID=147558 RepID=A0A6A5TMS8_9PLEO|nr:hypothetical protein CC80DRAFT_537294 [Byssothecium circinans]
MEPYVVHDIREDASSYRQLWQYPDRRTPGAFRAVVLDGLLHGYPGHIEVVEWPDIKYPLTTPNSTFPNPLGYLRYAAVSHVWQYAFDVGEQVKNMPPGDQLDIAIMQDGHPDRKTLSWPALRQLARAIDALNRRGPGRGRKRVEYMWLDFFCLDQIDRPNDDEKALQICIIGDIYEQALRVVVMIGGMGGFINSAKKTPWMDRGWTLQESVINPDTWVCVTWQPLESTTISRPRAVGGGKFRFVWLDDSSLDCLIPLKDLLDIVDYGYWNEARVRVLDGTMPQEGKIARHALRAALCRDSSRPNIKFTGIWRSMLMRTSQYPIDVVYSAMGLFGLQIDPDRKNRDPTYLFNDMARKAAASAIVRNRLTIGHPCWLTLGRISGRKFEAHIPRDTTSQLIPRFPDIENNQPPTYNDGRPIVDVIESSGNYIQDFDMKFITHSHPHIIEAQMLALRKYDVDVKGRNLKLASKTGYCYYQDFNGRLKKRKGKGVWAVYVGRVDSMQYGKIAWPKNPSDLRTKLYTGGYYMLFMEYYKKRWWLVGNGIFLPRRADFTLSWTRYVFTVGENAQQRRKIWKTDVRARDARVNPFYWYSYGIIPLPDFLTASASASTQPRSVEWFGYKGDPVGSQPPKWRVLRMDFDMTPLLSLPDFFRDQQLVLPHPLYVVTARTSEPPNWIQESQYQTYIVRRLGEMSVSFSWGGWTLKQCQMLALDGVEGVMLPAGARSTLYRVRLRFGRHMIYVELKSGRYMKKEYHQMYVLPYAGYGGAPAGDIITPAFLQPLPLPQTSPPRQFYQPGTPVPPNMQTQYIFPQTGVAMYLNLPRYPAYTRDSEGNLILLR